MAENSPKHSQETWNAIKLEYQAGTYKTLKELATRYSINPSTLRSHIQTEKWYEKQSSLLDKARQEIVDKTVDLASEYLSNSFKRAKRLERIADASLSQASLTNDGIPLVDLEQVDILTRSELRIHELAKSSLRIAPVSQIDITGKVSIEHSLVNAIEKLREGGKVVDITSEQVRGIEIQSDNS